MVGKKEQLKDSKNKTVKMIDMRIKFDWLCPKCSWLQTTYELITTVKCIKCNAEFQIEK